MARHGCAVSRLVVRNVEVSGRRHGPMGSAVVGASSRIVAFDGGWRVLVRRMWMAVVVDTDLLRWGSLSESLGSMLELDGSLVIEGMCGTAGEW